MKIMLDAGHGYNTPGKRSPDGFQEFEFTRKAAIYAKELLETYENMTIYIAHSDQRDIPLKERTDAANRLQVNAYISIHANAYGSSWNDAAGIETYVYTSKPKEALELAQKVQRNLAGETGLPNRGVKTADLHVLRETHMTAILAECGFMTNHKEAILLQSDDYQRTCAAAIVRGIAEQYQLIKKQVPASSATKKLYRVQAGAFSDRKNAESLVERLKAAGFDSLIVTE